MTIFQSDYQKWFQENREDILRDFFTFLRFPSISTDPQFAKDVRKTAEWLVQYLNQIGCQSEIWETTNHPVVFASYEAGPEYPTILIYQHYDVQPVDPLDLWDQDPFHPVIKNNNVIARGAVDNKGQCFYSLCAVRAFLKLAKKARVNLKIFIEGEEESGSEGSTALLQEKKDALKADHLFVIDFGLLKENVPSITAGMRGLVSFSVEFCNSSSDLHSGTHGGIALNPNRALISTLAKLWDEKGVVQVPGFYDEVEAYPPSELAKLHTSFDFEEYTEKFGVRAFAMEEGCSPLQANWLRPVLEINGINGGYSGPGVKTVIPAKAEAKFSCRLVANQDPQKIATSVINFIKLKAPAGIEVKAEIHSGAGAFRTSLESPAAKITAKALEEVFKKPCHFQLCGASVPIVTELVKASSAEAVLFGMSLDDDQFHAPNELFGLDRFEQGFYTVAHILTQLSESS